MDTWAYFVFGLVLGVGSVWSFLSRRYKPGARLAARGMAQDGERRNAGLMALDIEQRVNLHHVLDALDEAVMVIGPEKIILLANQACHRFFPNIPDMVGRRLTTVILDPKLDDLVTGCMMQGPAASVELRGGTTADAVWRASVARLPKENGRGMVRLIVHDETGHARTEQIRREFVANASHELRTPLTIVHGYIESLLDGALEDPELARRFLKTARRHTERMGRLIEDMLAIAKLESGETGLLRIKPFSLQKCLTRVTQHLSSLIEQQSAVVECEIAVDACRFAGDRFYWEQILFNLIENALKNNPEPGLKIRVAATRTVTGGAHITVSDNGIGIPKASLPFIFKRFYRVEKDHSGDVPGTGLGLSIVKRAVEAHGGEISVESQPGQHTTFTITLPTALFQIKPGEDD